MCLDSARLEGLASGSCFTLSVQLLPLVHTADGLGSYLSKEFPKRCTDLDTLQVCPEVLWSDGLGVIFLNHSRILPFVIKNLEGVRVKAEWKNSMNIQHLSNRKKYLCIPKNPAQEYPQLHSYSLRVGRKHDFQSQTAWFLFHTSPALCDHWSVTYSAGSKVLVSQIGLITVIVRIHYYGNLHRAPRRVPGAVECYTGVSSYDDGVIEET